MDRAVGDAARQDEQWEPIRSALRTGFIIVDAGGEIVWIDENTRRRLNGGLSELALPLAKPEVAGIDCFVSSVDMTIDGEPSPVCIIQEAGPSGRNIETAIESVLADASSFARAIASKLRALKADAEPGRDSRDIDLLTVREREVLGLICRGKSDVEMSSELKLSRNTIRNHVASLYRKIGVNRRSAAIIWARERAIPGDAAPGHGGRER
jgi:DNA-binding CsgD family transcriptional regulator